MDREPRPSTIDERGQRIPLPDPEFENGMHPCRVFQMKVKVNPENLSFAADGVAAKLPAKT